MEKVQVYSKDPCVQCKATYKSLDKEGVEYEVHMLEDFPELVEQFKEEGHLQAPVVDTGMERWSGFQPDKIKELGKMAINETTKITDAEGFAG